MLQKDCFFPATAPCAAVALLYVLLYRSKLNIKIIFCFVGNGKKLVCVCLAFTAKRTDIWIFIEVIWKDI